MAPTIIESLGVAPLASVEGQSLLPLMHASEAAGLRSALLFGRPKQRALRVGNYKLVLQANRTQQLFDLATDPGEKVNVIDEHPIALRLCELALGEAIANPKKSERLRDQSTPIKIRPEFIKE